jgi:predicted ArsR family transcriptional regulator
MLRQQLLDTSRGRIVMLLQGGGLTADDIATRLRLTRSAVRVQIAAMERDGVVRKAGKRPGTTRPSHVFELTHMESLVTEIVGVAVRECCERSERPKCCFEIETAPSSRCRPPT